MCRRLILVLAACAIVLVVREPDADACGVRLTIKAPRVRKPIDRSNNPSQILLLGDPPSALSRELSARGHQVEVASSADGARREKYHAIVTDGDLEDEAKDRWPGAIVVVRRGNTKADANQIEVKLGAAPVRTLVSRTPARTSRDVTPIRTGPPQREGRGTPVAAGGVTSDGEGTPSAAGGDDEGSTGTNGSPASRDDEGEDDEAAASPARSSGRTRVATRTETEEPAAQPDPEREDEVRVPARFSRRIFFGNSTADLSSRARAKLTRNARWLKRHTNRSVVVEGHASVTGPPEPNQALSEVRARVVKDFLVEQGVEESRIETVGFGMTRPAYKPGYNGKNRRVVIKLTR